MADFRTAKLSSAPEYWSDGITPFSGYLLLAVSLPLGYSQAFFYPKYPRQQMPTRIKVPITNGQYDQATSIPWNSSIDPPNSQYVAYWYDVDDNLIAGPSALFTVSDSVVQLPDMTLTIPVSSGLVPQPNVLP